MGSRVVVRRVAVRVMEAAMGRAATVALRETLREPTCSPLVLAVMHLGRPVWGRSAWRPLAWGRCVVVVVVVVAVVGMRSESLLTG